MDKLIDLVKQPSTWAGTGIIGIVGLMFGFPGEAIQQAGTVAIALIGAYEFLRDENKKDAE